MYIVLTEYEISGKKFASNFYAPNKKQSTIDYLIKKRGLNEQVVSEPFEKNRDLYIDYVEDLENNLEPGKLTEIIHQTAFFVFIAQKSKRNICDSALSDVGVLHELIHYLHGGDFATSLHEVKRKLRELHSMVPGAFTYSKDFRKFRQTPNGSENI